MQAKASKRTRDNGYVPPPEQVHALLLVAQDELEWDSDHTFHQSRPYELYGPWAHAYQDVLSEDFWHTAQTFNSGLQGSCMLARV
jgi:hypothetical protein